MDTPSWLEQIYDLPDEGSNDRAIDLLFGQIDDLLWKERFEECNSFLELVDTQRLNGTLLVGLLVITHAAKSKLPVRPELVHRIEQELCRRMPDRAEALLKDLR